MNIDELLAKTKYNPDKVSHLIPNQEKCKICRNRVCENVCPAAVYKWDEDENKLLVNFENCLECGACRIACTLGCIDWNYPNGSKGVIFKNS